MKRILLFVSVLAVAACSSPKLEVMQAETLSTLERLFACAVCGESAASPQISVTTSSVYCEECCGGSGTVSVQLMEEAYLLISWYRLQLARRGSEIV